MKYVALIRKEETTDFWVDIPDLPGCVSYGETIEETEEHFKETLDMHLEDMREEKLTLPEPRSREEVLSAEEDPYVLDYIIEIKHL